MKGWDDLIKLEGQIRKQRQRAVYEQREARQQLVEWTAITFIVLAAILLLIYMVWLVSEAAWIKIILASFDCIQVVDAEVSGEVVC